MRFSEVSLIVIASSWIRARHDSIAGTMRNPERQFFEQGWCHFEHDARLLEWISTALAPARASLKDPRHARWHRCGDTWFAGVNVLPNRNDGSIGKGTAIQGKAIEFINSRLGLRDFALDAGQVSVCFPGYPQPMPDETAASACYRRERDAAHVDGLLPEGLTRRRHLREVHSFILGIPLVEFDAHAAPFVVWEKSHELMRRVFKKRFAGIPADQWGEQDVTAVYHAARRQVFETCKRVEIHARPGEAFIAHRLVLHGIAPWRDGAVAGEDGRMICYFRPEAFGVEEWLGRP